MRVAEVSRTPPCDRRSAVLHCRVVCSRTLGSSDLRMRGTMNSTRSLLNPSSPHHRAAVGPNSAASRPSDSAPARTFSSHVAGVARCRKTLSAAGNHVPSSSRSHHCCELRPQVATSSRETRWCCVSAFSNNRRSPFTPTQRHIDNPLFSGGGGGWWVVVGQSVTSARCSMNWSTAETKRSSMSARIGRSSGVNAPSMCVISRPRRAFTSA